VPAALPSLNPNLFLKSHNPKLTINSRVVLNKKMPYKNPEDRKAWCKRNKDKLKVYKKTYCQSNKDKVNARNKAYRKRNKDKIKSYNETYYKRNADGFKTYYQRNKDKILAGQKVWKKRNKDKIHRWQKDNRKHQLGTKLREKVRKAVIHRRAYVTTIHKLIGCDVPTARSHLEGQFEDWMSWDNYGRGTGKWCIDHIQPIGDVDLEDSEAVKRVFHYTNMQPLEFSKNSSKGKTFNT
jgi:hypothetical protein